LKLLLITEYLPYGSGESFIYPEIRNLLKRGIELRILPAFESNHFFHEEAKSVEKLLLAPCPTGTRGNPARFLKSDLKIFRCRGTPIENTKKFIKNRLMAQRASRFSHSFRNWQPDHIHAHWANHTSTLAWRLSELSAVSWSFTAHRYDIIYDNLFREKSKSANFVRFISKKSEDLAGGLNLISESATSRIIYMGVDCDDLPPLKVVNSSPLHVVVPASLLPVKGIHFLLLALAQLEPARQKNLKVRIFGDGPLKEFLLNEISRLALGGFVTLENKIGHSKLLDLYRSGQVDFVILPSVDLGGGVHEGVPVSLMEAMSFGIPVISTRTGGIPELVVEGAGILVPEKDSTALKEAIQRLADSKELRETLGRNAQVRIQKKFSSETNLSLLLEQINASLKPSHSMKTAGNHFSQV
jgi:colanic acid/amylovoran biosynthesis glycosyltransferase